jgi:hypothetical protein
VDLLLLRTASEHLTPTVKLWRAVVIQAVIDAGGDHPGNRLEVAQWVMSPDLEEVCSLADLNPEPIAKGLKEIILAPRGARAVYMATELRAEIMYGSNRVDASDRPEALETPSWLDLMDADLHEMAGS